MADPNDESETGVSSSVEGMLYVLLFKYVQELNDTVCRHAQKIEQLQSENQRLSQENKELKDHVVWLHNNMQNMQAEHVGKTCRGLYESGEMGRKRPRTSSTTTIPTPSLLSVPLLNSQGGTNSIIRAASGLRSSLTDLAKDHHQLGDDLADKAPAISHLLKGSQEFLQNAFGKGKNYPSLFPHKNDVAFSSSNAVSPKLLLPESWPLNPLNVQENGSSHRFHSFGQAAQAEGVGESPPRSQSFPGFFPHQSQKIDATLEEEVQEQLMALLQKRQQQIDNQQMDAAYEIQQGASEETSMEDLRSNSTEMVQGDDGRPMKKQRMVWSQVLHNKFEEAVRQLGGPWNTTPTQIHKVMNVPNLTLGHIKSHLQKYRHKQQLAANLNMQISVKGSTSQDDKS